LTTNATPSIDVIIVNYNAGGRLARCVRHLAAQTLAPSSVIIVDNASTDSSLEEARAATDEAGLAVTIIEAGGNIGFAAANNLAAQSARADWLAFLNPDAYAHPDWLEQLDHAIVKYPWADAFGSTQLDANAPTRIDGAGDVYNVYGIPYRGGFGAAASDLPPTGECFAPCAAAALWRRETFERLGGFDERFFCYGEDVDLGFRLRLGGGRSVQVVEAVVLHEGSGLSGRHSDFAVYHGNRNKIWLAYKNMPGLLYWPFLPVRLFANLCLLIVAALRGQGDVYFRALRDGVSGLSSFSEDRRRLQKTRKASLGDLAGVMAWSPLTVIGRKTVLRGIKSPE
jgi:GT2 family glycosyltransferase